MSPELQASVEIAYTTFASYQRGAPLAVCTCQVCVREEDERLLRSLPLRELSVSLLFEYSVSCHNRLGPKAQHEQRFFLPRFLELIARGEGDRLHTDGTAMALSKLRELNWQTQWPENEVATINAFFRCLTVDRATCLDVVPSHHFGQSVGDSQNWQLAKDVGEVLMLVEEAGGDTTPVLTALDDVGDPAAAVHFAQICRDDPQFVHRNLDIVARHELASRIEAVFFEVEDQRLQQILSDGLEAIEL